MVMKSSKKMLSITLCLVLLLSASLGSLGFAPSASAASTTVTLSATADSYVNSAAASTNYGADTSMVTKDSSANDRQAYLKFNLSSVSGTVSSAKLRLYVKSKSANAMRNAYAVANDSWTESGLTYANRPAHGNPIANAYITSLGWVEFDVTSYIMSEAAGDDVASIFIQEPTVNNDVGIDFYSKENGSNAPQLVVITESSSPHPPITDATPFVHPGGLFKQSDLDRMKYMVEAGIEPWLSSYNQLKADAKASYNYTVRGNPSWTIVDRDGGVNNTEFESDVNAAYMNALMWVITGDTRHAAKAVQIFNTWSNLTTVKGGGTEALNAGLYAYKLIEAAEIIKSTYDGWAAADLQKFKDMLVYPGYSDTTVPSSLSATNGTFYWRIYNGDPGRHGNQDLIAWRAMAIMGVFLDNRKMYDRAIRYFKGLPHRSDDLPYASGPSLSGAQLSDNDYFTTFQFNRGTTVADWGYNGVLRNYIWENGQNQESSRDQQHAFFGLGIAAGIAEVAWNQGDGVWNYLDNRLLKGFEFTGRYNTSYVQSFPDQTSPWVPDNFIKKLDRTGRWYSKVINPHFESNFTNVSRGDFASKRPIYEQALAHFQVRMGFSSEATKWTQRSRDVAIALAGYEKTGFSLDHPGWGALTFRRPALTAGDPIQGMIQNVPQFAMNVVPGIIEAEHYDYFPIDGQGRTYSDTTSGNSSGVYRSDGVDIASTPAGGYALKDMANGEWLTYTVYVPDTGNYKISVDYSATSSGTALKFAFGGSDATSAVTLPSTGGSNNWGHHTIHASASLTKGVQAMRVFVSGTSNITQLDRIYITKTGAGSTAFTLTPVADSYINNSATTTNYGTASSLVTKQFTTNDRSAYLKFDLGKATGSIQSAKLRLYVKSKSANASRTVYAVADDSWTEQDITFANKPGIGSALATASITAHGWVEFDITSYIVGEASGNGIASVHVKDPNATNNVGIDFYSKENGKYAPQLVVVRN